MKKLFRINLVICLFFSLSVEAQFFKKLKEKVQDKVENTVVNNVSDKAAAETNENLNKLWAAKLENTSLPVGTEMVESSEIPDSYSFGWKYSLNMKTASAEMKIDYYLKEGAEYVGMKVPQSPQMFTVLDTRKNLTVLFLSSDGQKYITATRLPEASAGAREDSLYAGMELKEIGRKTILGYECQGFQTENEEAVYTFYVTDETGVSFNNIFQANRNEKPKTFNPEWLKNSGGLLMQMEMESKKDPSEDMMLTCTGIEKASLTLNKSDYN